jgi:hypothetical protein
MPFIHGDGRGSINLGVLSGASTWCLLKTISKKPKPGTLSAGLWCRFVG